MFELSGTSITAISVPSGGGYIVFEVAPSVGQPRSMKCPQPPSATTREGFSDLAQGGGGVWILSAFLHSQLLRIFHIPDAFRRLECMACRGRKTEGTVVWRVGDFSSVGTDGVGGMFKADERREGQRRKSKPMISAQTMWVTGRGGFPHTRRQTEPKGFTCEGITLAGGKTPKLTTPSNANQSVINVPFQVSTGIVAVKLWMHHVLVRFRVVPYRTEIRACLL
jgi:hypothetical protein